MILYLEDVPGLNPEDLLARADKHGNASARGPLVRLELSGNALDALETGQKLHVVGTGNSQSLAGRTPKELVNLFLQLGLRLTIRLRQVHLIANHTGSGGGDSFAAHLYAVLGKAKLRIDEIKAPLGDVRCDSNGKIWIKPAGSVNWQPSSPALNYYCGPHVQDKHKRLTGDCL